jgi:hypothetical protein
MKRTKIKNLINKFFMKRLLVTLTIALSLISFSSFANDEGVSPKAIESFNSSFKNATEVYWTISDNYFKASFLLNGQYVSAFYDTEGEMIALTRNISSLQLPIALQAELKKKYDNYWITDVLETATDDGTAYYVTLEDAENKVILKSTSNSEWFNYKKLRKS